MTKINGIEIHHEAEGAGTPIVFVHGFGATSNVWHAQRLTHSKSFRVIVYDRSGCGRSHKGDNYSIEAWTDELAGLLDHLAVPAAIVVGHSLGTLVAQRFAAKYASRTKALILAGGEASFGPDEKAAFTDRSRAIEAGGLIAVAGPWLNSVLPKGVSGPKDGSMTLDTGQPRTKRSGRRGLNNSATGRTFS